MSSFFFIKEEMEERIRKLFQLLCIQGIHTPDGVWKAGFVTLDIVKVENKNKERERIRLRHFNIFVVTVIFF